MANNTLKSRLNYWEKKNRFILSAIEMALSMGDYQGKINKNLSLGQIYRETGKRIDCLVTFETQAFYIIDPDNSDLVLSHCRPEEHRQRLEDEVEFLINKGLISLALGERRGISIPSKEKDRQIFLHVIATCSRIRGVFIGLFPACRQKIHDAAFEILSIILRNLASTLESIEYRKFRENQKCILETQLQQKTQEIIQYERKLQNIEKTESIETLTGGIAHEFNNALTAVMLNIDLLRLAFPENKQVIKHVDAVKRSGKYMAKLTKQLLAYAQGGKYKAENISINKFMRDALPAVMHVVDPSIIVEIKSPPGLYNIRADLTQIRMVLTAILTNASEAIANDGRILICARNIEINARCTENNHEMAPGHYVCLTIEDNGVGMDENTCRRIFDPFFTTRFQGRGLGMAAVYGIIKNHDGYISVYSKAGKGTKVSIFLPEAETVPVEKNETKHLTANMPSGQRQKRKVDICCEPIN